jgi:hypothetical protein
MVDEAEKAADRQVLASIYLQQARYSEAEPLLLADAASADSRTALTAYIDLAAGALMQRHYAECEGYARQALEIARQTPRGSSGYRQGPRLPGARLPSTEPGPEGTPLVSQNDPAA